MIMEIYIYIYIYNSSLADNGVRSRFSAGKLHRTLTWSNDYLAEKSSFV